MRTVVNAAIIKDKKILLVRKKKVWILPGGKPEPGESDLECLAREVEEEIPGVFLDNFRYYKSFLGVAPHRGDVVNVKVYLADMLSSHTNLKPAAEISGLAWVSDFDKYNLADSLRREIINALRQDNYL